MPDTTEALPIEAFIHQVFEENFEQLLLESGHTLSAEAKATALQQVLLYWRKLRNVAERVTDTEVLLTLPGQTTPQGREYTIQGVVDIVREDERVVMYDIKTHDADYVRANLELYQQQLNVYTHIWQELRQQRLDGAAVIATDFPRAVKDALSNPDPMALAYALDRWEPLIPIPYDAAHKDRTLFAFGEVVDCIAEGRFAPPPVEKLHERVGMSQTHDRFGTRVCRNCDARFACDAYRQFALGAKQTREFRDTMLYFIDENEREEWRTASMDAAASVRFSD
jgi:hypothetical protein